MRETFICFDGPEAFAAFSTYATRDEEAADPVRIAEFRFHQLGILVTGNDVIEPKPCVP